MTQSIVENKKCQKASSIHRSRQSEVNDEIIYLHYFLHQAVLSRESTRTLQTLLEPVEFDVPHHEDD